MSWLQTLMEKIHKVFNPPVKTENTDELPPWGFMPEEPVEPKKEVKKKKKKKPTKKRQRDDSQRFKQF